MVILFFFVFLQNETATVEEFHQEIQTIMNYPLKEFIIPFLRVSMELSTCTWRPIVC